MYYSQTKVIMGGLAHVPVLIFIVNFIKCKFLALTEKLKAVEVKAKEPKVKLIEINEEEIKAEKERENEVKEGVE